MATPAEASNKPLIGVSSVTVLPQGRPEVSANIQWNREFSQEKVAAVTNSDGMWYVLVSQEGLSQGNGHEKLNINLSAEDAVALGSADQAVLTLSQQVDNDGDGKPDQAAVRVVSLDGRTSSGSVGPDLAAWDCANQVIELGAMLSGCELTGASLVGANFSGINLSETQAPAINLKDTNLNGVNFSGANLTGADLSATPQGNNILALGTLTTQAVTSVTCPSDPVDFSDTNLDQASLAFADYRCGNFSYAFLFGADMQGADIQFAYMLFANLSYALLDNADLYTSDLEATDLSHASLTGAYLVFALLDGANLTDADLTDAILTDVCYDSTTI